MSDKTAGTKEAAPDKGERAQRSQEQQVRPSDGQTRWSNLPVIRRQPAGAAGAREFMDYKTSMIIDEDPLRGVLFYYGDCCSTRISVSLTHYAGAST